MIEEAAGDGKGRKGRNLNFVFFSKQHFVAGLSL